MLKQCRLHNSHGGEDEPRVLLFGEGVSRVVACADDAVDGGDDLLVEETVAAAVRGPDREDEGERRGSDARIHGRVATVAAIGLGS